MTRRILVSLTVEVPKNDRRAPATIVSSLEAALKASKHPRVGELDIEVTSFEIAGPPGTIYTVHPFDDEWVWDPERSGAYPWATSSLKAAIDHANLVRLEYASTEGADPDWLAGFWSSIYLDEPDGKRTGVMIGYVDPLGNYTEGDEPPVDANSNWVGQSGSPD